MGVMLYKLIRGADPLLSVNKAEDLTDDLEFANMINVLNKDGVLHKHFKQKIISKLKETTKDPFYGNLVVELLEKEGISMNELLIKIEDHESAKSQTIVEQLEKIKEKVDTVNDKQGKIFINTSATYEM
jgi:hypothetical protein